MAAGGKPLGRVQGLAGLLSTQDGRSGAWEIKGLAVGVRRFLRVLGGVVRVGRGGLVCVRSGGLAPKLRLRWGGRADARRALYIAAFIASRYDPAMKAFRARLQSAGKPLKLVLTACARKLLTILNAMLRDGKDYRKMAP